jgi:hypothetical protein
MDVQYDMGESFISDASTVTGTRFQCAACGCDPCSRVCVRKPGGSSYSTEFVSCSMCRVLYHWPGELPRAPREADSTGVHDI